MRCALNVGKPCWDDGLHFLRSDQSPSVFGACRQKGGGGGGFSACCEAWKSLGTKLGNLYKAAACTPLRLPLSSLLCLTSLHCEAAAETGTDTAAATRLSAAAELNSSMHSSTKKTRKQQTFSLIPLNPPVSSLLYPPTLARSASAASPFYPPIPASSTVTRPVQHAATQQQRGGSVAQREAVPSATGLALGVQDIVLVADTKTQTTKNRTRGKEERKE